MTGRITAWLRPLVLILCLASLLSPRVARAQFVFYTSGLDTTEIVNYEWAPDVFQQRPSLFAGFDTLSRFAVGDLDGDGSFEIVVTQSTASLGRLHVFTYVGATQSYIDRGEFTFSHANVHQGEIAIGDLDGDQQDEVVLVPFGTATPEPRPTDGGMDSLFIVDFTSLAPIQAQAFELENQFITPITNVLVADIVGDEEVAELALLTQNEGGLSDDREALGSGTVFICSPQLGASTTCALPRTFFIDPSPTTGRFPTSLAAGDLAGDGVQDLVIGYGSGCPGPIDTGVRVYESALGVAFPPPLLFLSAKMQRMTVTDVEGDNIDELVAVANGQGDATINAVTTNHYFDSFPGPFFTQDLAILPLFNLPAGEFCFSGTHGPGVAVKPPAYIAATKPVDICNGVDDDGDGDIDEDFASACSVDLEPPCEVAVGTATCNGTSGPGPCTTETTTVECETEAGPPCGMVTGTQTCSGSGVGMCMPPGQEDCSMDFGDPCGELFGTLACDDPGATCLLLPKFAGCMLDLGGNCGEVLGVTLCDSSGPSECIVGETTEVDCLRDLGPPCGVVQGTATCGPEGEGECVLPGNGTPETGYDTDNDCDGIFGECEDPHWECNPGLIDGRCPQGIALCSAAGAATGCIPLPSFDSDGDGLEDHVEEQKFIDLDCDGTPDVFLPDSGGLSGVGVDPNVKDLLLELDWMVGEEPTENTIARLKEAFALAPDYAGQNNYPATAPLAAAGINLWIDTGSLDTDNDPMTDDMVGDDLGGGNPVRPQSIRQPGDGRFAVLRDGSPIAPADCSAQPDGSFPDGCPNFEPGRSIYFRYGLMARHGVRDPDLVEDGATTMGSCSDGIDNGMDGADVTGDPGDCVNPSDGEDGLGDGSFTCSDGIDNGADGADRADPDCRVDPGAAEDGGALGTCINGIDDNPNADGADAYAPDWAPAGPDPDCTFLQTFQEGAAGPQSCFDCIDNDGDGSIDALDTNDCPGLPLEDSPSALEIQNDPFLGCSCWDGVDNGAALASGPNMQMDGQDPACTGLPEEDGAGFGSCWDGIDNGSNGFDGTDASCQYNLGEAHNATRSFLVFETTPATIMHEFGHTLGLGHGGPYYVAGQPGPGDAVNCKQQHASIMNYAHSTVRGMYQAVKPEAAEGPGQAPGTCADGMDNDGDGDTDEDDWEDCRGGSDLNDDGVLDGFIIDFAPPRFVEIDGTIAGRGQDLTPVYDNQMPPQLLSGIVLDETGNLDEGLIYDPTDSYNVAWFSNASLMATLDPRLDRNPALVPVGMNGFATYLSEDGMSTNAPGDECYNFDPLTGAPENDDGTIPEDPNELDPQCYGVDYNVDGNITPGPMPMLALNLNSACGSTVIDEVHDGANDWLNLALPVTGSPLAAELPPDPGPLDPDEAREALRQADVDLRFVQRATRGQIGDVVLGVAQVRNLGLAVAKDVAVELVPTDGLEIAGVPGECTLAGSAASCSLGTLRAGEIRFVYVTLRVLVATPGFAPPERRLDAVASTPGDRDPDLSNNLASLEVGIVATCDPATYEAEDAFQSAGELHFDAWKLDTQGYISVIHPFTEIPRWSRCEPRA